MHAIRVPSLAENVNEATIAKWLVHPGDQVEAGQDVVEMMTEKAEFTVESDTAGTVSARLAPEKSVLPVGAVLCMLDATEDEVTRVREENDARLNAHARQSTVELDLRSLQQEQPTRIVSTIPGNPVRATPAARRLAKEHGLDLALVAQTLQVSDALREEHVQMYLNRADG